MEKKMNLQLFADNVNTTADAGLSVEMETEQPGAELLVRLRVSQGNVGSSATETPAGT